MSDAAKDAVKNSTHGSAKGSAKESVKESAKGSTPEPPKETAKEQIHPQEHLDRQIVQQILNGDPTDYNLAELARLRIRYQGFPGARTLQADLEIALNRWQLSESELFAKTRQIHQQQQVYKGRGSKRDDWS